MAVIAAVLVVGVLRGAALLLGTGPGVAHQPAAGGSPRPISQTTYVVRSGDTLWSIADRLDPGTDPRPLVDRLAADLGGPGVQVGQRIRLPAAG